MKDFVQRMVEEHAELVCRINKLHDYVYSEKSDNDDKVEFANKAIQLSAMKKYEEALRARLENQKVYFDFESGEYLEKVGCIKKHVEVREPEPTENVENCKGHPECKE